MHGPYVNPYEAPRTRKETLPIWSLWRTFGATACFATNLASHTVTVANLATPSWPPAISAQMLLTQGFCVVVTTMTLLGLYYLFEHKNEPRAFVLGGMLGGGLGIWLKGHIATNILGEMGILVSITTFFAGLILICIDYLLSKRS